MTIGINEYIMNNFSTSKYKSSYSVKLRVIKINTRQNSVIKLFISTFLLIIAKRSSIIKITTVEDVQNNITTSNASCKFVSYQ